MHSISRRSFLKAAAAAGTGLVAAGCIPRRKKQEPTAEAPLKLGVLLPYSRVYAVLGQSITKGMELYFDSIGWVVGGRPIEWLTEDTELDPQVGLRKARKFIEHDRVDLLTGLVSTGVAYAVRDLVHATETVLLIANAGANKLTRLEKSPYIFRTSFSNWQPNHPMGAWLYHQVAQNVFVSAPDNEAGHEMIDAFKETFQAAGGLVLGEIYPPLGTSDYGQYLAEIGKSGAAASYSFFSGSDAVRFVKQFGGYGLSKHMLLAGTGFLLEEDVLPAQGAAAEGGYSGLHWALTLDNPENRRFTEEYKQMYGKEADVFAVQGYDTARVIAEALKLTGGETQNKKRLIDAISAVRFNSPRGPFEFDPETHNVVQNIYIRQVASVNGALHNQVLDMVEKVRDPGV